MNRPRKHEETLVEMASHFGQGRIVTHAEAVKMRRLRRIARWTCRERAAAELRRTQRKQRKAERRELAIIEKRMAKKAKAEEVVAAVHERVPVPAKFPSKPLELAAAVACLAGFRQRDRQTASR
jgi:hypothetical protein